MNDLINGLASSNFIAVNKSAIKLLGLEEAILFAELISEYKYWDNKNEVNNGWFFSTIDNIESKTTLSGYVQRRILDKLSKMDLIEVDRKGIPAQRYIKINEEQVIKLFYPNVLNNLTTRCEEIKQLEVKELDCNKNKNNKNKNNNINNNVDLVDLATEIVEYLNKVTGKRYSNNSKDTIKLISARLKEKYTLEDFKAVIDYKYQEWNNNTEMSKYLRPATLFGNKFRTYLEDSKQPKAKNSKVPDWYEDYKNDVEDKYNYTADPDGVDIFGGGSLD